MTTPHNPEYPISYTAGFIIFWGLALGSSLFIGGLLTFAISAILLLMLTTHEHAHAVACIRNGVKIHAITFTALGGQVDCDIEKHSDNTAFRVYSAGVLDTSCYAVSFVAVLAVFTFIGREAGINFADPYGTLQRLQFLNSIVLISVIFVITNILPITIKSEKHGEISTDGWAAFKLWWKNR